MRRLFKAYCDKWPDSAAKRVVIGSEFYVRFGNGDGMRRVRHVGDFDDEGEWFVETVTDSELIAGWDRDASLERNAIQYPRRPP